MHSGRQKPSHWGSLPPKVRTQPRTSFGTWCLHVSSKVGVAKPSAENRPENRKESRFQRFFPLLCACLYIPIAKKLAELLKGKIAHKNAGFPQRVT